MFESIKNRKNVEKIEKKSKEKYHLSLFELKIRRKENGEAQHFPPRLTKMYFFELEENQVENERKIQMTFLPLLPVVFPLPKLCFSFGCRELSFFLTQL